MKIIWLVGVIFLIGFGFWYFRPPNIPNVTSPVTNQPQDTEKVKVIATNLDTPWGIAFLPNGDILVTERKGVVRLIKSNGELQQNPVATIANAKEIGEGGLLGITIDPDFASNDFVYLYYTYRESNGNTLNRVVRMKYENNQLINEDIIVDKIPGASNHNGGRIKFGPDKMLYIGTGDAQEPSRAQDTSSLAGKILRVDVNKSFDDAQDNSLIYSYGHRNVQGITWDTNGTMFATEHGRSGVQSGFDELNLIMQGKNYGWSDSQGDDVKPGTIGPIRHSGATNTWAPSGMAFFEGSIYFGGLRGTALYEAVLSGNKVTEVKEHFKGQYGRIRDVVVGPDNMIYFTTSNQDGRGNPAATDDRIIRVIPQQL